VRSQDPATATRGRIEEGSVVADLAYIALLVACSAVVALVLRGLEKL
jgi:hypothetical protein